MGDDGAQGCELVREHGGHFVRQDADGCTVYGMPKFVTRSGIANMVVKLPRIAATISGMLRGSGGRPS
jgi:two-component system, chemotaxis family, protein-glutamate methylesterase/glutaminase